MKTGGLGAALGLTALFLVACDEQQAAKPLDMKDRVNDAELATTGKAPDARAIHFGFDLRNTPEEDARQYLPFLAYLKKATGHDFKLHFTPKNSTIVEEMGKGLVQFAAMGAVSYIEANKKYDARIVARGLNGMGEASYRSFLVVRPESPIQSVADIRDKRLAFGGRSSTQGYLIPRIILSKNDLSLDHFDLFMFTGSHANCANAVVSRKADVCGMQDTLARELEESGLVRIIHRSNPYPSSGIAAGRDVPDDLVTDVTRALLGFKPRDHDADGLYNWHLTEMAGGFVQARNADYDDLRYWRQRLTAKGPPSK